MSKITNQYIAYIELMESSQFELAGGVPCHGGHPSRNKKVVVYCRGPKPWKMMRKTLGVRLIKQLQEYERFKKRLRKSGGITSHGGGIVFLSRWTCPMLKKVRPQPTVLMEELLAAYRDVLKRCDMYEHHTISRERLSTRERMSSLMAQLQVQQFMPFPSPVHHIRRPYGCDCYFLGYDGVS